MSKQQRYRLLKRLGYLKGGEVLSNDTGIMSIRLEDLPEYFEEVKDSPQETKPSQELEEIKNGLEDASVWYWRGNDIRFQGQLLISVRKIVEYLESKERWEGG